MNKRWNKNTILNISFILMVVLLIGAVFQIGRLLTRYEVLQNQQKLNSDTNLEQAQNLDMVDLEEVNESDHIRGNKAAPIALIEYSDFECPFCKSFHPTAKKIIEDYNGQVMWVYRHFPLEMIHDNAFKEAEASECAFELGGEDVFWQYNDLIYQTTTSNDGLDLEILPSFAAGLGLDVQEFQECLNSGRHAPKIQDDMQKGFEAGVSGTPTIFIVNVGTNEAITLRGNKSYETIKANVDKLLN